MRFFFFFLFELSLYIEIILTSHLNNSYFHQFYSYNFLKIIVAQSYAIFCLLSNYCIICNLLFRAFLQYNIASELKEDNL